MSSPQHQLYDVPCCEKLLDIQTILENADNPGPRIVLTTSKAVEIYQQKLSILQEHGLRNCPNSLHICLRGRSVVVSSMFNVSPKTIRDIWTRRTWQRATSHLWKEEDSLLASHDKSPTKSEFRGRPKGVRDSRPRKRPSQQPCPPPYAAAVGHLFIAPQAEPPAPSAPPPAPPPSHTDPPCQAHADTASHWPQVYAETAGDWQQTVQGASPHGDSSAEYADPALTIMTSPPGEPESRSAAVDHLSPWADLAPNSDGRGGDSAGGAADGAGCLGGGLWAEASESGLPSGAWGLEGWPDSDDAAAEDGASDLLMLLREPW